jgi:hypothetical protein
MPKFNVPPPPPPWALFPRPPLPWETVKSNKEAIDAIGFDDPSEAASSKPTPAVEPEGVSANPVQQVQNSSIEPTGTTRTPDVNDLNVMAAESVSDAHQTASMVNLPQPAPNPPAKTPKIQYGACEYGLECIKGHMLRGSLYMAEAIRFMADKEKVDEATAGKVRLAREQLLCEDDFEAAMDAPPETKFEILKLLASTRETWKYIETSGIDNGFGTIDDIHEVHRAIQALYDKAYAIDRTYRLAKEDNSGAQE